MNLHRIENTTHRVASWFSRDGIPIYNLRRRMARYSMKGGGEFEADSNINIVSKLRESSRTPGASMKEFMEQTSLACQTQTGAVISTYNTDEFVADLLHNGFLTIIPSAKVYTLM